MNSFYDNANFIETVENTWGEVGKKWLADLPELIEYFKNKWQLHSLEIPSNLSCNMVVFAIKGLSTENEVKVVLKLCPIPKEIEQEINVLKFYQGCGATRLLDCDLEKGVMLLERILPGTTLKNFFPNLNEESIKACIQVMNQLHSVKLDPNLNDSFPSIETWLQTLFNGHFPEIPEPLQKKARDLSSSLLKTQKSPVLLHGDLHHDNILKNQEGWISIDPKGVIGEPAYDVGAFIRNPMPELFKNKNLKEITLKRLDLFSQYLKIERKRLLDWSFVQAILSACWALEDKMPLWNEILEFAMLLDRLEH